MLANRNARLSLKPEAVDVGELGRHIVAVLLRRFEARLLDGLERFLIEACAATFGNLGFANLPLGINLDA
jgi:hypothetical protein